MGPAVRWIRQIVKKNKSAGHAARIFWIKFRKEYRRKKNRRKSNEWIGRRNLEGRRRTSQCQKRTHSAWNRSDWRRKTQEQWTVNGPKNIRLGLWKWNTVGCKEWVTLFTISTLSLSWERSQTYAAWLNMGICLKILRIQTLARCHVGCIWPSVLRALLVAANLANTMTERKNSAPHLYDVFISWHS